MVDIKKVNISPATGSVTAEDKVTVVLPPLVFTFVTVIKLDGKTFGVPEELVLTTDIPVKIFVFSVTTIVVVVGAGLVFTIPVVFLSKDIGK